MCPQAIPQPIPESQYDFVLLDSSGRFWSGQSWVTPESGVGPLYLKSEDQALALARILFEIGPIPIRLGVQATLKWHIKRLKRQLGWQELIRAAEFETTSQQLRACVATWRSWFARTRFYETYIRLETLQNIYLINSPVWDARPEEGPFVRWFSYGFVSSH